jgi:hypothetical protein
MKDAGKDAPPRPEAGSEADVLSASLPERLE